MSRALSAFRAPRKPPKHAPKGTQEGGQFIGPASILRALIKAFSPSAADKPDTEPKPDVRRAMGRFTTAGGSVASLRLPSRAPRADDRVVDTRDPRRLGTVLSLHPSAEDIRARREYVMSEMRVAWDDGTTEVRPMSSVHDPLAEPRRSFDAEPRPEPARMQVKPPSGRERSPGDRVRDLVASGQTTQTQRKELLGGLRRRTPAGPEIEVVASTQDLSGEQIVRGEHLTPAGRRALDALGPAGHPRVAAIPDTEGKVRDAYRLLAIPGGGSDHWVSLADLRKLVGEQVSREELDATLIAMMRHGDDVSLTPQSYGRGNAATRIPAAIMFGGQEQNLLHIDDPTLSRPSEFAAVAMAEELINRRAGRSGDPMMALIPDADLQAEIDRRAARDPFVARELAALPGWSAVKKPTPTPPTKRAPATAAQKMAAAKAFDVGGIHARLASAQSREEGEAALRGLTVAQLRQVSPTAAGVSKNKPELVHHIVAQHVGARLSFAAIRDTTALVARESNLAMPTSPAVAKMTRAKAPSQTVTRAERRGRRQDMAERIHSLASADAIRAELAGITTASELRQVGRAASVDVPASLKRAAEIRDHIVRALAEARAKPRYNWR